MGATFNENTISGTTGDCGGDVSRVVMVRYRGVGNFGRKCWQGLWPTASTQPAWQAWVCTRTAKDGSGPATVGSGAPCRNVARVAATGRGTNTLSRLPPLAMAAKARTTVKRVGFQRRRWLPAGGRLLLLLREQLPRTLKLSAHVADPARSACVGATLQGLPARAPSPRRREGQRWRSILDGVGRWRPQRRQSRGCLRRHLPCRSRRCPASRGRQPAGIAAL